MSMFFVGNGDRSKFKSTVTHFVPFMRSIVSMYSIVCSTNPLSYFGIEFYGVYLNNVDRKYLLQNDKVHEASLES